MITEKISAGRYQHPAENTRKTNPIKISLCIYYFTTAQGEKQENISYFRIT